MLSGVDRYLGFVFMTTAMIYGHLRGIMFMKKFMESVNYVTNRAARPESIIIHQKDSIEDGASTEHSVLIYNTFWRRETDCGISCGIVLFYTARFDESFQCIGGIAAISEFIELASIVIFTCEWRIGDCLYFISSNCRLPYFMFRYKVY